MTTIVNRNPDWRDAARVAAAALAAWIVTLLVLASVNVVFDQHVDIVYWSFLPFAAVIGIGLCHTNSYGFIETTALYRESGALRIVAGFLPAVGFAVAVHVAVFVFTSNVLRVIPAILVEGLGSLYVFIVTNRAYIDVEKARATYEG